MKILSNFNTRLASELLDEARTKYGERNVLFVRRDRIYVILKVIIPGIIMSTVVGLIVAWTLTWGDASSMVTIRFIVYSVLGLLVGRLSVIYIGKIIDYYMDFTIITQKQILSYDQSGIFKRNSRSLDLSKIKSVNIEKDGVLRSMFNFGSIIFFSEGDNLASQDEQILGNIRLNYVKYPRKIRDSIVYVIKKS